MLFGDSVRLFRLFGKERKTSLWIHDPKIILIQDITRSVHTTNPSFLTTPSETRGGVLQKRKTLQSHA